MAKIIIGLKVLGFIFMQFSVPFLASIFSSVEGRPPELWYHISMTVLFLPEMLFFFSTDFRKNVIESFEIKISETHYESGNRMTDYATVICIKMFGILVLTDIWYNVEYISFWWKIALLLSAFGLEGFGILKVLIKKRM